MENKNEEKVYEKNRFEFSVWINENLVCKRNFKINNFCESSFQSMDFKRTMDEIVDMIDDDLKSKSRLYMWYNYDENSNEGELNEPPCEPWENTFKIVVTDNDREVFAKIWDGRYPREIRQNVDLLNKFMQIGTYQDGNPIMKEYSKVDRSRLDIEHYIKYIIGSNRKNLADVIIKKICEVCSPETVWYKEGKVIKEGKYSEESDYTLSDVYRTTEESKKEIEDGKTEKVYNVVSSIKYPLSTKQRFNKLSSNLGVSVYDKTINYFNNECYGIFTPSYSKKIQK